MMSDMYNSDGLIDSLEHSEYYRGKIEQKNTYKLLYDNMITTRIETRIELYGDSTFDDSAKYRVVCDEFELSKKFNK